MKIIALFISVLALSACSASRSPMPVDDGGSMLDAEPADAGVDANNIDAGPRTDCNPCPLSCPPTCVVNLFDCSYSGCPR